MNMFVKVVAVAAVIVAIVALWSGLPVRAALLAVLAVALWVGQSRSVQRPQLLLVGAIAAVVVLAGMFVGPYAIASIDISP